MSGTVVTPRGLAPQETAFKSGNELAALAASQVGYHLMGYYPITPSTEISENLAAMAARGQHDIVLVPADGEHGAAGICYGASVGGGRVFGATSANGLLYALEQLPVQAGTRMPMVLNLVTRTVSGPLDIRGDHSDLYYTLNTGWIVLMARDPQAVYDLNLIAVRLSEHADVQLPVIVAYDGFFTSHQKRRVQVLATREAVQAFVGPVPPRLHALDPRQPVTFGPYMNDPDLINNKYQQHLAMAAARRELPRLLAEYGALTGRYYGTVDAYRLDDAAAALVLLGSAAETARAVADALRAEGQRVGVLSLGVLRPFPAAEVRQALAGVKAALIADRADSYGADGGNLTHEIKAALKDDPENRTLCLGRVYGLGGKEFDADDARALFKQALTAARRGRVEVVFDYYGHSPGDPAAAPGGGLPPLQPDEVNLGLVRAEPDPQTGALSVQVAPPWALMARPKRVAPGHGACPGCGIFTSIEQFMKGIEGDVVVLYQTGCAMVTTTGYPYTAHRVTYIHNLFQNGAATLAGLVEMFHARRRRGELPAGDDITFIMITGDGGMDIGMGPAIGTALRGHRLIILEYDNQGYMNTGSQLSYTTPLGHATSTSHVGPAQTGKTFHHKDTPQIMAATGIPYVFTGIDGYAQDLVQKAAKAQWYAQNVGLVYGKVLITCPLNWKSPDEDATEVMQAAVNSCFFPLYEVEQHKTRLTYDPEAVGRRVPLSQWLERMGKARHLLRPECGEELAALTTEVERRWRRLKALHEHPDL